MFESLLKTFALLDVRQRRHYAIVLVARMIASIGEFVGVSMVVPLISLLARPDLITANRHLAAVHGFFGAPPLASFVIYFAAFVVLILLLTNLLTLLSLFLSARYVQRLSAEFAASLYRHSLKRDYRELIGAHTSGLLTRIVEFCPRICDGIILSSINLAARILLVLVIVTVLLAVEPVITMVASTLILGCYVVIYILVKRRVIWLGGENAIIRNCLNKRLIESFSAVKVLRMYHMEDDLATEFRTGQKRLARNVADTSILAQSPYYLIEIVAASSIVLIAVYLSLSSQDFGRYVGVLTLFGVGAFRLLPACQRAYNDIGKIANTQPVLEAIHAELAAALRPPPCPVPTPWLAFDLDAGVTFRRVSFTYPNGTTLFEDLDFAVPLDGMVEIRGESGSGKSTLIELLAGLLQPDSGSVIAAGVRLAPSTTRAWQSYISYVPQDSYLLDDTLAYNIALALDPHPGRIERALRLSGLQEIVERLPDGLGTRIGENAGLFSGGQRQRIGLARALYREAPILLLDEALTSLDLPAARRVMTGLGREGGYKAVLFVTHREGEVVVPSHVVNLTARWGTPAARPVPLGAGGQSAGQD